MEKEDISGEGESDESQESMSPNIPYYNNCETSKFLFYLFNKLHNILRQKIEY